MNKDLANVNEWLIANKLTLNKSKTEFILIGSRQKISTSDKPPSLTIDAWTPIEQVSNLKSLGVYIDENLSWNIQINKLSKKIASGIGALKRIRTFVPHRTLMKPHFFYYCSVVKFKSSRGSGFNIF